MLVVYATSTALAKVPRLPRSGNLCSQLRTLLPAPLILSATGSASFAMRPTPVSVAGHAQHDCAYYMPGRVDEDWLAEVQRNPGDRAFLTFWRKSFHATIRKQGDWTAALFTPSHPDLCCGINLLSADGKIYWAIVVKSVTGSPAAGYPGALALARALARHKS